MDKIIKVYSSLCEMEEFKINGVDASYEDFGEKRDTSREHEDYCCGNMKFTPKLVTQEILDKYSINVNEYNIICEELEDKLSFGSCGSCS